VADRSLSLSNLSPAQKRQDRKRVGRGLGSGKGRYSGRGLKGQKSRSGSHKMRAGFEGGQMPAYMRLPKERGSTSKDAMPIGPFRTSTQAVNLRDLDSRFEPGEEVTVDSLKAKGLIRNTRVDVKILGSGDLTKKLTVTAHRFSETARQKIEAAGGSVTALREETAVRSRKRRKVAARKRAEGAATSDREAQETVPSGDSPPDQENT
jgi:large subunit ribosomal protein L15